MDRIPKEIWMKILWNLTDLKDFGNLETANFFFFHFLKRNFWQKIRILHFARVGDPYVVKLFWNQIPISLEVATISVLFSFLNRLIKDSDQINFVDLSFKDQPVVPKALEQEVAVWKSVYLGPQGYRMIRSTPQMNFPGPSSEELAEINDLSTDLAQIFRFLSESALKPTSISLNFAHFNERFPLNASIYVHLASLIEHVSPTLKQLNFAPFYEIHITEEDGISNFLTALASCACLESVQLSIGMPFWAGALGKVLMGKSNLKTLIFDSKNNDISSTHFCQHFVRAGTHLQELVLKGAFPGCFLLKYHLELQLQQLKDQKHPLDSVQKLELNHFPFELKPQILLSLVPAVKLLVLWQVTWTSEVQKFCLAFLKQFDSSEHGCQLLIHLNSLEDRSLLKKLNCLWTEAWVFQGGKETKNQISGVKGKSKIKLLIMS